jgi:hypothetical protein
MAFPARVEQKSRVDRWINALILVGSAIFVLGLTVSAIFAREWRVLHFFQALIYVAIVVLTWRKRPVGFGAGLGVGLFWDVLFVKVAGHDVVQELASFFRTGQAPHASLLLSLFAALGHLLIIIACVMGLIRLRPAARPWMERSPEAFSRWFILLELFSSLALHRRSSS